MRAVRLHPGPFHPKPALRLPRLRQTDLDLVASLVAILVVCGFVAWGSTLALRAIELMF